MFADYLVPVLTIIGFIALWALVLPRLKGGG
jgi:hypothetical protein